MSDKYDDLLNNKISSTPEKTEAPKPKARRRRSFGTRLAIALVIALCVVALLVCGAAVWGYSLSVNGKNLPNVYVDGLYVGGMTREETENALRQAKWDALEGESLAVSLPAGAGFSVDYLSSGAVLGLEQAVEAACSFGHDGDVFSNLRDYLKNLLNPVDVATGRRALNESYIRTCMDEGLKALETNLNKTAYVADVPGEKLVLFKGAGGIPLDTEGLYRGLHAPKLRAVFQDRAGARGTPGTRRASCVKSNGSSPA